MARLTAAQRKKLPASSFAGPNRSYPVNDASHARNALARVSQFGSPSQKKAVRSKVAKRYPNIGKSKASSFLKRKPGPPQFPSPHGQATTRPGQLSGGDRITEDDPRWNPATMGNKRGSRKGR